MTRFVKLRSWHIRDESRPATTLCGRPHAGPSPSRIDSPPPAGYSDTLPLGERSCETCLRLDEARSEQGDEPGPDA
jgi:hypothetical protein